MSSGIARVATRVFLVAVACVALLLYFLAGRAPFMGAETVDSATVEENASRSVTGSDHTEPSMVVAAPIVTEAAHPSNNARPSKDAPWLILYQTLMPLAMEGDDVAASRLFREAMHCSAFAGASASFDSMRRMYPDTSQLSPLVLHAYEQKLAELQHTLDAYASECARFDPKVLQEVLYPIMRQAALTGDAIAASCYVYAYQFQNGNYSKAAKSAMKEDYARHALDIAQRGVENGNWAIVELLWAAYNRVPKQFDDDSWLGDLVEPDMLTYYTYALLVRNGLLARDDVGVERMEALNNLLERVRITNEISPSEVANAEAWANETYAAQFSNKPYPQGDEAQLCEAP